MMSFEGFQRVRRPSRHQRLVVLSMLLCVLSGSSTVAFARTIHAPDYQGTLSGFEVSGDITLKLRDRKLRPLIVEVNDFVLQCEDGTTSTRSVTLQGDVRRSGEFLLQARSYDQFGELYAEVAGRLKEQVAKGSFYMISNLFDPAIGPDCSTPFPQQWKASKVR
jgi:hypothetical protein